VENFDGKLAFIRRGRDVDGGKGRKKEENDGEGTKNSHETNSCMTSV